MKSKMIPETIKIKPRRISQEEFNYIYSKVPRLCVDLVIKNQDGILLVKRQIYPYQGYWHLPGGTVLLGERLKDTIERIAKTETGLSVKIKKILGIMEFPVIKDYGQPLSIVFLVIPKSGELKVNNEGKEIKFHNKLPSKMYPEHKEFLIKNKLID